MKVIFLDFDGVLNAQADFCRHGVCILPSKIRLLKQIADASDAQIVLSTSWREHWFQDTAQCDHIGQQINDIFKEHGLQIVDKIPQHPQKREDQIKSWLDAHPETEQFVVLDDALLSGDFLHGHFVKTSAYFGGLDETDVQKAIGILGVRT